jgi:hypothetical protein
MGRGEVRGDLYASFGNSASPVDSGQTPLGATTQPTGSGTPAGWATLSLTCLLDMICLSWRVAQERGVVDITPTVVGGVLQWPIT